MAVLLRVAARLAEQLVETVALGRSQQREHLDERSHHRVEGVVGGPAELAAAPRERRRFLRAVGREQQERMPDGVLALEAGVAARARLPEASDDASTPLPSPSIKRSQ
jgi:hypothetical protein